MRGNVIRNLTLFDTRGCLQQSILLIKNLLPEVVAVGRWRAPMAVILDFDSIRWSWGCLNVPLKKLLLKIRP